MFPFASHPEHGYKIAERLPIAAANLAEAGKFARENDMRITAHPGQWSVPLSAPPYFWSPSRGS
jgi:UV DNA damage endonuclease